MKLPQVFKVAAFLLLASVSQARQWTDVTGTIRFEADLIAVSSDLDIATFLAADGNEYRLPVEAISAKDQTFVKAFAKKNRPHKNKKTIADVPREILEQIRQTAADIWPDDEQKQMELTKDAVTSYLTKTPKQSKVSSRETTPTSILRRLKQEAAEIWPADPDMQHEHVETQLGYYRVLKNYRNPQLPALVVIQIKQNAKKFAPHDYRTQLRYVYAKTQAGIAYLAKMNAEQRERSEETTRLASQESAKPSLSPADRDQELVSSKPISILIEQRAEGSATTLVHEPLVFASNAYATSLPSFAAQSVPCCEGQRDYVATTGAALEADAKNGAKSSWRWFARTHRD